MRGLFLLVLCTAGSLACSSRSTAEDDEDDDGASYCSTLTTRLRECGVLGAGRYQCTNYRDAAEVCETRCLREGECSAIREFYCIFAGSVSRCFQQCIGLTPFPCSNGTVLAASSRCDGLSDCPGGEDELDCVTARGYKCRNLDQFVDFALYCDGFEDCRDGSDEPPDCAEALVCDGDVALPESQLCNGVAACVDGADEPADCAVVTCG